MASACLPAGFGACGHFPIRGQIRPGDRRDRTLGEATRTHVPSGYAAASRRGGQKALVDSERANMVCLKRSRVRVTSFNIEI